MKIDSLIVFLFYPLLLVDSINGFFLLNNFSFPVSQLYKTALLGLLCIRIFLLSPGLFIYLLSMLTFIFLQTFTVLFYIGISYEGPMTLPVTFLKFFLFLLSFFYFKIALEKSLVTIESIKKICLFNLAIIVGNLLLGFMGLGFSVYTSSDSEVSVGVKGFFFAGNELSAVYTLLVSVFLAFYTESIKKRSSLYILILILFIFSASLATKSAIGGMLILGISAIIFRRKYIENTPFDLKNIFFITVSIIAVLFVAGYLFVQSAAFERMKYYYDEISNIYRFMMSGRDQFLANKLRIFTSENSLFKFLFGVGEPFPVEMDIFDTFFKFGFTGILMIYSIYIYIYRDVFKYYFKPDGNFSLSMINLALLLVFFQSFVSGHVLYSGMAGPFYGMVIALSFYSFDKKYLRTDNDSA
jgi:hypothetical protein